MLDFEDSELPINLGDFSHIESLAGGALPSSFKKFYLLRNGGYLESKELYGDECVYDIHGFESLKHGDLPIEQLYQDLVESYEFLAGLVPFAFDQGGNNYLVSLRAEDYGKIYIWLHDEEELKPVFDSFEFFEKGLAA
ncbi:SMI1/KNR4 family protein [Pseudomonas eucalypticola]|uniref:SMI1/KNR4 family protein n=1 Tax=Pseudomonas eucalypticola TaxID=2599595 RepID=A0A7D5HMK9_9PSED|nr:SMI1/KNR4 family protein [Pseudomonas eucalypticola]QKZ03788.1 SMI1/KNR4 family protein [Pseudomonas eucalypticola]